MSKTCIRRWPAALASLISLSLALGTAAAAAQGRDHDPEATDDNVCPRQLHRRSTEQVLEAHLAAVRSGNAALIACDYAKKAIFMAPGSVVQGRSAIQATFAGLLQSAGALNSLVVTSSTTHGDTALLTYTIDSQHIVVSAGVDTFVVEKGRIVLHTVVLGGLTTR